MLLKISTFIAKYMAALVLAAAVVALFSINVQMGLHA